MPKIKDALVIAIVAIIAVGLFNRFAPSGVKSLVNG